MQDNLHAIYQLVNKISKASEEEEQVKLELGNCGTEYEEVHGSLADKMDKMKKIYILLW